MIERPELRFLNISDSQVALKGQTIGLLDNLAHTPTLESNKGI